MPLRKKDIELKYFIIVTCIFLFTSLMNGQVFDKNLNTDSLMQELVKNLPAMLKDSVIQHYNESSEAEKEFLLIMLSMPQSSEKELVENYEKNKKLIQELPQKYSELVPDSLIIYIEFEKPNKLLSEKKETIDIEISKIETNGTNRLVTQKWNLDPDSANFKKIISSVGWNSETIKTVKQTLKKANCISIENGNITTVGFARSGMGKYFYKIFKNNLTKSEIEKYNDHCNYIYYKNNVVLEYEGGAIGPECFPDEKLK